MFDFPLYPYLVDSAWIARFEAAGHDVAAVLESALAADAAVLEGIPEDVTVGLHICRGNFRSSWMCEGSLEPSLNVCSAACRMTPSWWNGTTRAATAGSSRSASFAKEQSWWLVSPKTPELEAGEDVLRSMEKAADIVGGMERLAISPQCGFASVMVGNKTNEAAQWRKLELVGRVADGLWGRV